MALVTAAAIAAAPRGAPARAQQGAPPAHHPRRGDGKAHARLRPAGPARGRPCPAERQSGRAQRTLLQRLRHGRAPYLHQCRHAVRRQDAERGHRRARARNRPPGRRPPDALAREARAGADPIDRRHAARRRRHGGGRRRRRDTSVGELGAPAIMAPQSAILHSLLAYVAHAGRPGRPCRREIPQRHPSIAEGNGRSVQAPEQRNVVQFALHRSLSADPSDAGRPRRRARGAGQGKSLLGRQGPAATAAAPRSGARQVVRLPGARRHRRAALSGVRSEPAGALCARHLHLPACGSARRHRADGRADPAPSPTILISTSSRARPCWKAATPRKPSHRCAARCSSRITPR